MARRAATHPGRFRVAVRIQRGNHYGDRTLRGIAAFAQAKETWQFIEDPAHATQNPEYLDRSKCDGAVVYTARWGELHRFQELGIPFVNTTSQKLDRPCARAMTNNAAIGGLGLQHLRQAGLRCVGFLRRPDPSSDKQRGQAFEDAARREGLDVLELDAGPRRIEAVATACKQAGRRVGILCATDTLAMQLLDALQQAEVSVPQQVALLGCGNDELACAFTDPTLSSIDVDAFTIGYRAAELLQGLMTGQQTGTPEIAVQPAGVVERESTQVIAVEDDDLAAAIRFAREHACKGIDVRDIVAQVPLTRRSLERGFARAIGRTPQQEIRRVQLDAAREMLVGTDLPIGRIAERIGLRDGRYFSQVFRKHAGTTPSAYRDAHQRLLASENDALG
jgi:LacI family transcriptional regulator